MCKVTKKIFVIAIVVCMLMATLAGCGNGGAAEGNRDSQPETTDQEKISGDVTTYDVWLYATQYDYYGSYSENPIVQYLNYKFDIELQFTQPAAGTEQEQLSLMLGSGQYADMFDTTYLSSSLESLYEDGVIIDLTELARDYMPNLMSLAQSSEDYYKAIYNDDGRILKLPIMDTEESLQWGGLVYRRDILEIMTGENVEFPSGNEDPVTIEDWDYMLPLYQAYFEAAGLAEYASFILPYNGVFDTGELVSGFGIGPSYYVDGDTVKYGPMEDGFYEYVTKMKEWYDAGYIYADFASRTNDVFYLPNTALTYGGAAGVWFGLSSQVGDVMSMPEYDLYMDVRAIPSPINTAQGITEAVLRNSSARTGAGGGYAISRSCEEVEKLLTAIDYLYAPENANLTGVGLTAEQVAEAGIALYTDNGLEDGAYWIEDDGSITRNSILNEGGALSSVTEEFMGIRLPAARGKSVEIANAAESAIAASAAWKTYDESGNLPAYRSLSTEENSIYTTAQANLSDYVNSMVPKFITGVEELNEENWAAFQQQIIDFNIEAALEVLQASLERYNNR